MSRALSRERYQCCPDLILFAGRKISESDSDEEENDDQESNVRTPEKVSERSGAGNANEGQ